MDVIQSIKEVWNCAKKLEQHDLLEKLADLKDKCYELRDENRELKERLAAKEAHNFLFRGLLDKRVMYRILHKAEVDSVLLKSGFPLRELVQKGLLSEDVVPIVEPVKLSSTLVTTIRTFAEKGRKLAIVVNPEYGNFLNEVHNLPEEESQKVSAILREEVILRAVLQNATLPPMLMSIVQKIRSNPSKWLAVYADADFLDQSLRIQSDYEFAYGTSLVPDSTSFRRKVKENRILFKDCFHYHPIAA